MANSQLLTAVLDGLAPAGVELCILLFFILGWAILRPDNWAAERRLKLKLKQSSCAPDLTFDPQLKKVIESEWTTTDPATVLKAWRAGSAKAATPQDILKRVVQAFVDLEPASLVRELVAHIQKYAVSLKNSRTATIILDVVGRAGKTEVMVELWTAFSEKLDITPTYPMYEMLLGGWASVGNEEKVEEIFQEFQSKRIKMTARGYSLTIKGFLKHGLVDAVMKRLLQMKGQGLSIPSFAVAQFLRISSDSGRLAQVFPTVEENLPLAPEAVTVLMEDACRRADMEFARRVEKLIREAKQPLPSNAYDPYLKLCCSHGDVHALDLFKEMQGAGHRISEGLCVGLLARCAETKFLRFAEEVIKFSQARGAMSIALYSALMKVYAYCGMYDKACDLYDQIRADGLEPDSMMYGCLMKFSVECGRTDLSRALSERAPCLDIQNYMSLIRAAGRDKDVDRAFSVLQKLEAAGLGLDVAAHNCVLDVCVSAGDMARAQGLVKHMKEANHAIDIITYNTLIKGFCQCGDLRGAKDLLHDMHAAGLPPNDVSYNCLINAAVSHGNGNYREAWETIELMEKSGVAVDQYTLSIMMKGLKKVRNPRDVAKALALLDRSAVDIFSDEILLNTVLETCIRHRELRRLETILSDYWASPLRPQLHTYGALIKACSSLHRVDKCWDLWCEMEEHRGIQPNDIVLGCMLYALVTNGQVDEAVELFTKWKGRVKPNTVLYSTLIKGFANAHQASRAMEYWHEMRQSGIEMNTVVYNAVIDAQARTGAMDEVSQLVKAMAPDGCTPDVITYSTIVKGYCVKGDLDKAFEVFRGMQKDNMAGDSIIYNTVLDGCTRHGRFDLADTLLEDMEHFGVVPSNFTLGILVKMWGRRHKLDKAFEAVATLPKRHGFHANAQVSTCLICACLNNGAMDQAMQVFDELKRSPRGADTKAYGAVISGCMRLNKLDKARQLVEEAYGLGPGGKTGPVVGVEPELLEQLLKTCSQRGLAETQGMALIERLRAAKVPINGRIVGSAFGGSGNGRSSAVGRKF